MCKTNVPRSSTVKLHTKRWRKEASIICLFIILLVCGRSTCYSQQNKNLTDSAISTQKLSLLPSLKVTGFGALYSTAQKPLLLPTGFYTQTIGYFCLKEIQIEKAVKMPLRFRLGSVAYTDKMENKNSFRASQH